MEKSNEKIIKSIVLQRVDNTKPFGQSLAKLLFPLDERALLHIDGHFWLLLPDTADSMKELEQLIELLSYLRSMAEQHIVYVQKGENGTSDFLFLYGSSDMKWSSAVQGYDLGCDAVLTKSEGGYSVNDKDGKTLLPLNVSLDFLAADIQAFFCSRILPTASFHRYVKQGFLSDNDYSNRQALNMSRWSIWVAIGIACLSPILTLILSNHYGISTIEPKQYQAIIEHIVHENGLPCDSIIQSNTTLQVVCDTLQQAKEQPHE